MVSDAYQTPDFTAYFKDGQSFLETKSEKASFLRVKPGSQRSEACGARSASGLAAGKGARLPLGRQGRQRHGSLHRVGTRASGQDLKETQCYSTAKSRKDLGG